GENGVPDIVLDAERHGEDHLLERVQRVLGTELRVGVSFGVAESTPGERPENPRVGSSIPLLAIATQPLP
ncbi:MAG: hypothetical protein V3T28_01635, partial [Gemmatimonadales bacterium]